jgi:enoyl-[acyl-carrier protein] reductase I
MGRAGIMEGKRGLIMGVANERSIAWGIAQSLASHGAELAFTYQGDAFRKRVTPLVGRCARGVIDCDVSSRVLGAFAELATNGVSSTSSCAIAFSDREQLRALRRTTADNSPDDEHLLLFVHGGRAARRR